MDVNLVLVVLVAVFMGGGVMLVLERSLTRILLGFLLIGNAVTVMFVDAGRPGAPPIVDGSGRRMADPLPQALVLTAIVISVATTSFGLALAYRSGRLLGHDEVADDLEDAAIRERALADQTSSTYDAATDAVPEEEGADR